MIPNLPSLPTDNLYKFVALSGVLLVALGFIAPWTSATEFNAQFRSLDLDFSYNEIEVKAMDHDVNELVERGQAAEDRETILRSQLSQARLDTTGQISKPGIMELEQQLASTEREKDALAESARAFRARILESRRHQAAARNALNAAKEASERHTMLRVFAVALTFIGVSMASWGFRCWYTRVQRHLDAQLAAQMASTSSASPSPKETVAEPERLSTSALPVAPLGNSSANPGEAKQASTTTKTEPAAPANRV